MDQDVVTLSAEEVERELNESFSIVELEERFEMEEAELAARCRCIFL